jgi:hypothetical protein
MFNFTGNRISMIKHLLSKKAFWDTSFEDLEFEKSSLYVMEKVFNYGTWNDQVAIMKYYGLSRIRQEIVQASYLRKPVLSFLCTILQIPKTDFSCYNKMQLNPLPWNY